jgi:hypothetical protein
MDETSAITGTKEKGRKQNTRPTDRKQLQHMITDVNTLTIC